MTTYTQWVPFQLACRWRVLQQGSLNVGNTRQNIANLLALALVQIAAPSNPPWAKYSTAINEGKKILIWPALVPGFVNPIGLFSGPSGGGGGGGSGDGRILTEAGNFINTESGNRLIIEGGV